MQEPKTLAIIIKVSVLPEKKQIAKAHFFKLKELVEKQEGYISFTMYEDNDFDNLLWFHQNWETRDSWLKYMANKDILAINSEIFDTLEYLNLNELIKIEE